MDIWKNNWINERIGFSLTPPPNKQAPSQTEKTRIFFFQTHGPAWFPARTRLAKERLGAVRFDPDDRRGGGRNKARAEVGQ